MVLVFGVSFLFASLCITTYIFLLLTMYEGVLVREPNLAILQVEWVLVSAGFPTGLYVLYSCIFQKGEK